MYMVHITNIFLLGEQGQIYTEDSNYSSLSKYKIYNTKFNVSQMVRNDTNSQGAFS